MKTFETLYKRTKTGAIQFWHIEANNGVIEKLSGQMDTINPVKHTETCIGVNIGKSNETTPEQQAELQAESDWKKKKDSGYKPLSDFGIESVQDPAWSGFRYNYKGMWISNLTRILEDVLPQFNSDAAGNVKPMLAKPWEKVKNIQYPCIIEPKLDGVRCLLILENDNGPKITALSRSGKEYTTLEHIKDDLQKGLWLEDQVVLPLILDGEVYSDELTFQEITAAVKKTSPNSMKLQFRAYDVVNHQKMVDRRGLLEDLCSVGGFVHIQSIPWTTANNAQDVKAFHDQFVQEGNEGAMLRMFDGKYEQGFRSSSLLKVKEFDETEFLTTAVEYGQRGVEDLLVCCVTDSGSAFKAKVQGTLAQKIEFEDEFRLHDSAGKTVKTTTKHFGWTTDKLPRFPIGKALRTYE